MVQELVSVIIPVYNSDSYLRYCLESVVQQTYPHLEVLLIDDGSTDDSGIICDEFATRDNRFRVFHTENRGIGAAQNLGLDQANGDYIAFVDNDDILAHRNIEKLLGVLLDSQADMAKARWQQFGVSELQKIVVKAAQQSQIGEVTKFGNPLKEYQTVFSKILRIVHGKRSEARYFNEANWCRLYKRAVWEGIRFPEGQYAQDVMVAGDLYLRIKKVVDVDEVLYYWLQSSSSVTHAVRSTKFYHDNVLAGAHNFELCLKQGIVPQRSYYTLTGSVKLEKKAADCGDFINVKIREQDDLHVQQLIGNLNRQNRVICRITTLLRSLEKYVYDKKIHRMR